MQVSTQPYLKTYLFPFWSLGTLARVSMLVLAIVLPFFITYSTPNFFLSSHLQTSNQTITYNYNYHITITSNLGLYVYTNLYQLDTSRPPTITQSDSNSVVKFGLVWPNSPAETVQNVQITLLFNFNLNGVSQFGTAQGIARGYSLAQVSMSGPLSMVAGSGSSSMNSSSLSLLGYDTVGFYSSAIQSLGYLKYDYSVVSVELPSDLLEVDMVLNYSGLIALNNTPSILGQLVWSWIQYFPIFLTLYWILDFVFSFLVREHIIKRRVIHDPEYLRLVEEEEQRRERLRMQ